MSTTSNVRRAFIDFAAIRRDIPLLEVVGATVRLVAAGREWKGHCPFHADRTPSLTIYQGNTGQRWCCFAGCGEGDVLDFICKLHSVDVVEAARMLTAAEMPRVELPGLMSCKRPSRASEAVSIFDNASPAAHSLAERYLAGRGIQPPFPPDIRFDKLPYGKSGHMPCVICGVRDVGGEIIGIQRIFLRADGAMKADVMKPKLSLGRVSGGSIRIGELDKAGVLAVCEGPEDGLSFRQLFGMSVWVAAGVGNMPKMQFPPNVRKIVVGADNDEAGLSGARKAAQAFAERGLSVSMLRPLPGAKDWNDELLMEARNGH